MDKLENVNYAGLRMPKTLALTEKISKEWGTQLLILKMARKIKAESGAGSKLEEASAVRNWVNSRVRYVSDPTHAEMVGTPLWTLEHGGDCDDMTALAGALLQALGHQTSAAAVRWQGREWPTHEVLIDWTAGVIVDPVANVDVMNWPPEGYTPEEIQYQTPEGDLKTLDGLFAKFHTWYSKQFTKVFKPHTFLGKIMDPLGVSSRNLKAGKKAADVVGTAAAIVAAAYGLGAVMVGTGGGFWSTVGSGFSTMGKGVGKLFGAGGGSGGGAAAGGGGGFLGTAAKAVTAVAAIEAATSKPQVPTETPLIPGETVYAGGSGYGGGGGGYSGGVSSSGYPMGPSEPNVGTVGQSFNLASVPGWAWAVGAGVLVLALTQRGKS